MFHCQQSGPPGQSLFESVKDQKDEKAEEVQKVERQFRRIYDPNASWVLVTGFPRAATDRILITFRSIGRIVGKDWTNDGLHLQFSDPSESARALELDKLSIAGYPVRIQALPRLTSNISGPLRQMGAASNKIMEMELQPCVEFFSSCLANIKWWLQICWNIYGQIREGIFYYDD